MPRCHRQSIGINCSGAPNEIPRRQDWVAACAAVAGVGGHHRNRPHPTACTPDSIFCFTAFAPDAPVVPPPPAHHQVLHNANSGVRCGHDAPLPVIVLLLSQMGAAPGLNNAVRPQRRKVRTGGGGRRSTPPAGDGQEGQQDHPPRLSSHADTWMTDSLSALLSSWTTTPASKCSKTFLGIMEEAVTFLGGGGAIQGPAKGFCCTREGSFARVTLG